MLQDYHHVAIKELGHLLTCFGFTRYKISVANVLNIYGFLTKLHIDWISSFTAVVRTHCISSQAGHC
jgi:hypothetical protein